MTPEAARDEMAAVFKACWDPTGYTARWPDIAGEPPANESPWAKFMLEHRDARTRTLANAVGSQLHTYQGTITIQLFLPLGQGKTKGYELSRLVIQAYRAARGSVWYRRPRFRESGSNGAFELFNVAIDFTYDDS